MYFLFVGAHGSEPSNATYITVHGPNYMYGPVGSNASVEHYEVHKQSEGKLEC